MHRSILITTILVIMMITIVTIIKITIDSPTFQLRKASASAWPLCQSDPGQLYQLCFRSSRAWNVNIIQLLMFLIGSSYSWLYVHEDSDLVVIWPGTTSRVPQLTCIYVDQEQVGWGIMDIDIMVIWPGTTHPHIQRGLQADHWPAFRAALPGLKNSSGQDKVNTADSAFIFLIIQSQNQWWGWSGRRRWSCLVWSLLER